jgi:hypothetical protein
MTVTTTTIKPEAVEHLKNTLIRDYRNLRRAVTSEDPDYETQILLSRLGRTIEDAKKMLDDLSKNINK